MAFKVHGSLAPWGGGLLRRDIVANSVVLTQLDSVIADTDGFVALSATGNAILGHAVNPMTNDELGHNTTGVAGAEIGSFVGTFTHASDNETVAKHKAELDISMFTLYAVDPATGTFGTTTAGSGQLGVYFDLTDEDSMDETSVTDATAQYHSWGTHPDGTTNQAIVNIFESSVFTAV